MKLSEISTHISYHHIIFIGCIFLVLLDTQTLHRGSRYGLWSPGFYTIMIRDNHDGTYRIGVKYYMCVHSSPLEASVLVLPVVFVFFPYSAHTSSELRF